MKKGESGSPRAPARGHWSATYTRRPSVPSPRDAGNLELRLPAHECLALGGGVDDPEPRGESSTSSSTNQMASGGGARVFRPAVTQSGLYSRGTHPRLAANGRHTPQHILVVDDDVTLHEVLTFFLRGEYDVRHVTTAADALVEVHRDSVDLVLLDHRLPDRTGLDMLPELRSIRPSLPVIMMTGYGSEWICAAAFKLGVADYLQKPVSPAELVGAVRRILRPDLKAGAAACGDGMPMDSQAALCIPVQRVMGKIHEHYWDHLSLSVLARDVGMSKYRLSRRFHEVLGVTFRSYLLRVRLERAKSLLADGHTSITEVAQMVGLGDLPRFDKLFKRYTSLTPSGYRAMLLGHGNKDEG